MRISDWSSDVCSSDLINPDAVPEAHEELPELSVDHGDRQETIVVGTLIIGHDAGTDAERHVITGLGAGRRRKCQRRAEQRQNCGASRPEERREGEEGGGTCGTRGSPYN